MGYYTNYNLTVDSDNSESIIADLRERNDNAKYAIGPDGESLQDCKWYDSHNDLIEFSKLYPEVLFTLYGVGEEFPDIWAAYFLNGKHQSVKAEITFQEFDKKLLR